MPGTPLDEGVALVSPLPPPKSPALCSGAELWVSLALFGWFIAAVQKFFTARKNYAARQSK